jgi:hypothetical protein
MNVERYTEGFRPITIQITSKEELRALMRMADQYAVTGDVPKYTEIAEKLSQNLASLA